MTSFIPAITIPASVFANPAASILLPIALGTAVGYSCRPKETQKTYLALKQPPFRPPPEVFGPAWTLLYGLMGYSAYRAYSTGMNPFASAENHVLTKHGATLYSIQLGLNLIWMPLFFVAKRPIEATVDIVALTGVTGYLTYLWAQVDTVAGLALAPYLGWLGFATYLTVGVGHLNDWNLADKEIAVPPSTTGTKYVNEKDE
ncbi:putative translocator protein like protein [Amylocarpus encephaloides]|uniref:Translocator protein like protein n=1 Tax=Amylocarpus encephaloides TaxID=45428 RepID=A0A9P7YCK3_9HELO|nr:putative translocator protein like protein [Amylocarpus encephaloides]